jgi:hypothetical protein
LQEDLLERVGAIYRLDWRVFDEIERDRQSIPQALVVVVAASALAGLGQGASPLVFLGAALAIVLWIATTSMLWLTGLWLAPGEVDYARLLRGTGFAWAWVAPQVGASLPWVGGAFEWLSILLVALALHAATRYALRTTSQRAALICAAALGLPLLLVWLAAS